MPREQTPGEEDTVGDAGTMRETQDAPTVGSERILKVALWALHALLALPFAMAGLVKWSR